MSKEVAIITDHGEKVCYEELLKYTKEFQEIICRDRSLVIIMAANTIGSVVGYLACMQGKHVPLMLRDNMEEEQLQQYISYYNPNYVWVPEVWLDNRESVLREKYTKVYSEYGYVLLLVSRERISMNEELALLLTTSGTTGSRKLVRLSYKNLECNTKSICKYLEITEKDVAITSLPMSYTYGLSVINTHLYKKATLLLTDRPVYSREFWDYFQKYNGTSFSGVPFMYEMLIKLGVLNRNIETLDTFTVAGGKLCIKEEKYLLEYAGKYAKKVIVMYGQTEATARISYRPYKDMCRKIGSIGVPIPGGSMWLENQQGEVVRKPYEHGEITYSGDNVCMGYSHNYKDLVKGYENKGVLHTGDMGYIDEDEYFYVLDRCDGSIKINGKRLDLKDMENMLREKYSNVGIKCRAEKCLDGYADKRIKIEITTRQRTSMEETEILSYVEQRTGLNRKLLSVVLM